MSIRLKLVISYIFLICGAVFVSYFSTIAIIGSIITQFSTILPTVESTDDLPPFFDEVTDIYVDISYITKHEPEKFRDIHFLESVAADLEQMDVDYAFAINDEIVYMNNFIYDDDMMAYIMSEDLIKTSEHDRFADKNGNSDAPKNAISYKNQRYFVILNDFEMDDGSEGIHYFTFNYTEFEQTGFESVQRIMGFFFFVILMLILILLAIITKMIIKPLKRLEAGTKQIAEGNLEHALPVKSNDELGRLSQAFNTMQRELKASIDKQISYEENRKELISSISHDLKTPITSIKGYVEGILDGVADTKEKQDKYLEVIYSKANDMDRLIDDLFLFSKLDLNRLPFDMKCVNARSFFNDCIEEVGMDVTGRGIDFVKHINIDETTDIYIDRMNLKRVILNIVQNAIKYMDKDNQQIVFKAEDEGDFVHVSIKDNGQGISETDLMSIFDKFYRADKSRNTAVGGSGLGLSIAKQMIEQFGGKIWAYSDIGVGTTVHFTVRCCEKGEHADEANIDR